MSAVFYLESGVGQFLLLVMSIIEETEPDLVISMYSAYDLNASGAEALFKFNQLCHMRKYWPNEFGLIVKLYMIKYFIM